MQSPSDWFHCPYYFSASTGVLHPQTYYFVPSVMLSPGQPASFLHHFFSGFFLSASFFLFPVTADDFRVENMTIVNNAADKADNVDRMQDVIKIRRGAKAAIVNALVKGTGGSIDLIDMSDSKGAGNADSSVSITNSLNLTGKKLNGTLNTFAEPAGNTGTDVSLFTWTGYNFSSL